jgi:hypothetical protein
MTDIIHNWIYENTLIKNIYEIIDTKKYWIHENKLIFKPNFNGDINLLI